MAFTFNCMIVFDFSIFLKQMYGIKVLQFVTHSIGNVRLQNALKKLQL